MSYELVKRIIIKKDTPKTKGGVYITSHSNNDSAPFHSHRIESLSKTYNDGGQFALDVEIFRMTCEYAQLVGEHKSVIRYVNILRSPRISILQQQRQDAIHAFLQTIPECDIVVRHTFDSFPKQITENRDLEFVERIAIWLDDFSERTMPYDYMDNVENKESNIKQIIDDLTNDRFSAYVEHLNLNIKEDNEKDESISILAKLYCLKEKNLDEQYYTSLAKLLAETDEK